VVDWILSQPFALAVALLTLVAAVRSQCTYWLGRAVRAGVIRGARAERLRSAKANAAIARLERWGWPLIPVSFLTVGIQTATHLSAGLVGWRWPRYTAAASIGWVLWGTVYAAGGLAVFSAIAAFATDSPMLAVAILKVAAIIAVVVVFSRSKRLRDAVMRALNQVTASKATPASAEKASGS
jgi:membrane protein DedA with SNARE-associated domain